MNAGKPKRRARVVVETHLRVGEIVLLRNLRLRLWRYLNLRQ